MNCLDTMTPTAAPSVADAVNPSLARQIAALVGFFALVVGGRMLAQKVLEPAVGPIPAALIVIAFAVVFAWLVLIRLGGASLSGLGITTRGLGREVALGAVAAVVLAGIILGHLWLWGGSDAVADTWRELIAIDGGTRLRFALLGLAPAIGEELVFRGYLQPRLMRRLGFVGGLLATAAVFSAAHVHMWKWPPYQLVNLFIIGGLYGLLRGRDRSLIAPIVAHTGTWMIWAGM